MAFSAVTTNRTYEQIVGQVEAEIHAGRLVRGQRLPPERDLAETFGVSRGVVREAIKVLGAMGLVDARQGSGVYVRNDPLPTITRAFVLSVAPEDHAVGRLFEFRQGLETLAARAAAERAAAVQIDAIAAAAAASAEAAARADIPAFGDADSQFHAAIRAAADNPYLDTILAALRQMQRDVVHLYRALPGSMAEAARHHLGIAQAITAADPEAAAAAMAAHIRYTGDVVADLLRDPPPVDPRPPNKTARKGAPTINDA